MSATAPSSPSTTLPPALTRVLPGLCLAVAVAVVATIIEKLEHSLFGVAWVDALVFAILIGTALHSVFGLADRYRPGVAFASHTVLNWAIVLLGASISFATIGKAGGLLVGTVAGVVALGLVTSYAIGRLLGLPDKLATLVACGNSICGNSAIVAAAPVIGAKSDDVASSIAFTAVLGIIVVLFLPLVAVAAGLTEARYGILAGLTVYAVPQVLAATAPVGPLATQIGTVVKLMRVLLLGPVILLLGLKAGTAGATRPRLTQMLPWFILGFIALMTARSLDLLPQAALQPMHEGSVLFTNIAMAGLGLSVNVRSVLRSGGRVLAAGTLSILALGLLAGAALWLLPAH